MNDKEKEKRIKELNENCTFEEVVKMLVEVEEKQEISEVKENNLNYAIGELQNDIKKTALK